MYIFRYFCKEIFGALLALTTIILLIFLSNQFVQYLGRAASGQLPGLVVFQLMALELPNLLSLLLPLGFYVALLVAYGRLYADNEMIVLSAAGFSQNQLLKYTLSIASLVAICVAYLVFWVNPGIYYERALLIRNQGVATFIKTITPERFRAVEGGKKVFYVQDISASNTEANGIFYAEKIPTKPLSSWKIMWAAKGKTKSNDAEVNTLVLENGHIYQGRPGQANYKTVHFGKLETDIPQPVITVSDDVRTLSTKQLLPWHNKQLNKVAELHWRIAIPTMVFILTLLALPLSKVNARQGKYARLVPALLLYILYANFLFIGRDWLVQAKVPWWLGLWWLHGGMLLIAMGLLYFQKQVR